MTPADRTGSRAERFSTAMRRPATVALLLAFALIAAACEDAAQEAPGAATGTPGATGAEPGEAGQTLSIVDVGSGAAASFTVPLGASQFDVTFDGSMIAFSDLDGDGNAQVFLDRCQRLEYPTAHPRRGRGRKPRLAPRRFDDRVPTEQSDLRRSCVQR